MKNRTMQPLHRAVCALAVYDGGGASDAQHGGGDLLPAGAAAYAVGFQAEAALTGL